MSVDKKVLECLLSGAKDSALIQVGTSMCTNENAVCPYKNEQFEITFLNKTYVQCDYKPRLTFAYIGWLEDNKNE